MINPSKLLLATLLGLTLTPSLAAAQDAQPEPPVVADPAPPAEQPVAADLRPRGPSGELHTTGAVRELLVFQAVHGVGFVAEVCVAAVCEGRPLVAVLGLLPLAGVLMMLGMTEIPPKMELRMAPGHAVSINSGTLWGAANAGLLLSLGEPSDRTIALGLMGGQLAGLGLGHLYYRGVGPTGGQVGLTNTTAFWSLAGYGMLNGALALKPDSDQLATGALVALNGGLLAGGLLAHHLPMSRSRALTLDVGGLLGLGSGAGLYSLIASGPQSYNVSEGEGQGLFTAALIGTALGIGAAAYLTRGWDDDDEDVQRRRNLPNISLVPGDAIAPVAGEHQGGFGVSASWAW